MSVNIELHKVIDSWHKRASQVQNAHYDSGSLCNTRFNILGLSVVILSALLGGTEVILPVDVVQDPAIGKNISGVISLLIAILAGLQMYLKLGQLSERHRIAGAHYGEIKRSLEIINIVCEKSEQEAIQQINKIEKKMDLFAQKSPEIPQVILKKYRLEAFKPISN